MLIIIIRMAGGSSLLRLRLLLRLLRLPQASPDVH